MPQKPMKTPHPTSPHSMHPRRRTTPASQGRAGRRGRLALAGALALLVLLAAAGPASAYSSQYAFTISGHGWGHGIGMSQWGAYGYAKHGWAYKAILRHYYTGISFSNVGELDRPREPAQRPERRQAELPQRLHGAGHRRERWTIPAGTTATTT